MGFEIGFFVFEKPSVNNPKLSGDSLKKRNTII